MPFKKIGDIDVLVDVMTVAERPGRHMPKLPWLCPSVRSKRGPVHTGSTLISDLRPCSVIDYIEATDGGIHCPSTVGLESND